MKRSAPAWACFWGCVIVVMAVLVLYALMLFGGAVSNVNKTATQNAIEVTWDAEFHATLTAEAR